MEQLDFLEQTEPFDGDIICGPPFRFLTEFAEKAFELTNRKVAMMVSINALFGSGRFETLWSKLPVSRVLLATRPIHYRGPEGVKQSQFPHCWIVLDKEHSGESALEWTPNKVYKCEAA